MIPGTKGAVHSFDEVKAFAETYGLPVMIKPSMADGGRGMRNVDRMEDLEEAYNARALKQRWPSVMMRSMSNAAS